jgi:hypothetical protein
MDENASSNKQNTLHHEQQQTLELTLRVEELRVWEEEAKKRVEQGEVDRETERKELNEQCNCLEVEVEKLRRDLGEWQQPAASTQEGLKKASDERSMLTQRLQQTISQGESLEV